MAETQLQNMSAHHHAMVDFILENMHEKGWRSRVCAQFRITPSYLSIIWHSDVFREAFYERMTAFRDGKTREIVAMQIAVAQKAYERIMRILEKDDVEDDLVLDIANSTMKSLGFAPSAGAGPSLTREDSRTLVHSRVVAPGVLEEARTTLKSITHVKLPAAVGE